MNFQQRFSLILAAIALITFVIPWLNNSLDTIQIISSSVILLSAITIYFSE